MSNNIMFVEKDLNFKKFKRNSITPGADLGFFLGGNTNKCCRILVTLETPGHLRVGAHLLQPPPPLLDPPLYSKTKAEGLMLKALISD